MVSRQIDELDPNQKPDALQDDDIIIISAHTVLEKEISIKVEVELKPGRDQAEKE
jgi:hypothetical protein